MSAGGYSGISERRIEDGKRKNKAIVATGIFHPILGTYRYVWDDGIMVCFIWSAFCLVTKKKRLNVSDCISCHGGFYTIYFAWNIVKDRS